MYTRVSDLLYRIEPLSAFRKSRLIAAGVGGTFFALGNICKVPLKHFISGLGPAITTGLVSVVNLGYHMMDHYKTSDPDSTAVTLKEIEAAASTRIILEKFEMESAKSRDFLKQQSMNEADLAKIDDWHNADIKDLEDILYRIYNDTLPFNFTMYVAATSYGILNMSCHTMEFMLMQIYHNLTMFDYIDHPSAGNVLLSIALLVALYNGIQTFLEVKQAYETPPAAQRCDAILKLFDSHAAIDASVENADPAPQAVQEVVLRIG